MSHGAHIVGLGARSDCIATVPQLDAGRLGLTPDEVLVLVHVGRLATVAEVLERSTFSEPQTVALLLSLRAKGAIAPVRAQQPTPSAPAVRAAPAEEVELDPERQQELLALEGRLERGEDPFSLLGVPAGAEPAEVKRAFYELSKRLHPDRFYGRALGSFRPRVERVFRGLTEAHTTLTDPERREAYLAAHPGLARGRGGTPPPGSVTPLPREGVDGERDAERRARLARHPYLMRTAKGRELQGRVRQLLERGDTETALAEVGHLVQVDPKAPEVLALQAEVRRRHDEARAGRELARGLEALSLGDVATAASALRQAASLAPNDAEAAYRAADALRRQGADLVEARTLAQRAVELAPRKADYRYLLALLLLEGGAKKSARTHFEKVLELDPEHEGARAQVKKLRWSF